MPTEAGVVPRKPRREAYLNGNVETEIATAAECQRQFS
jgi:hypothetical protein